MATFTSDQLIQRKERVDDKLYKLFREDAPFTSSIGKKSIDSTLVSWLQKTIGAPGKIAKPEGADAVEDTIFQPTPVENVTQIISQAFKVSRTAEKQAKYGRSSELAEAILDAGQTCMDALEYSCVGSKQTIKKTSPMEFAGAQALIDNSMVVKTGATATPLNVGNLDEALLRLSRLGAKPSICMVTPEDAQVVAGFGLATGRYREIKPDGKIFNVVGGYAGANGTVTFSQNRILAAGDAIVYNPDDWKLLVFDSWQREPLAKVGDSKRIQVVGEYSLQLTNTKRAALIRRAA